MTMGDMMNTLIQPRHAKLGLAGKAENWPLANYALAELRQAFAGIVKAQPKFHGMPVGDLVDLALTQPLNAVEAAIKQQDAQKFATAYDQLGQGCNACHMELDHPYVVIKTPDAAASIMGANLKKVRAGAPRGGRHVGKNLRNSRRVDQARLHHRGRIQENVRQLTGRSQRLLGRASQ